MIYARESNQHLECECMCVRGREIITRPQLLLWNWLGQSAKERKCEEGKKKGRIKPPIVLTSLEKAAFSHVHKRKPVLLLDACQLNMLRPTVICVTFRH